MMRTALLCTALLVGDVATGRADEPQTVTNSVGMTLVRIEPGTFTMGQDGPQLEDYLRQKRFKELYNVKDRIDFDERPAHKVTITQPFLMGATEVTVAQYRQFDPDLKKRRRSASGSPRRKAGRIGCRPRRSGSMRAARARRHFSTPATSCRMGIRNGSARRIFVACISRRDRCRESMTGETPESLRRA
jgi:formylglycine-generating enzyme required for sulfatase activity